MTRLIEITEDVWPASVRGGNTPAQASRIARAEIKAFFPEAPAWLVQASIQLILIGCYETILEDGDYTGLSDDELQAWEDWRA